MGPVFLLHATTLVPDRYPVHLQEEKQSDNFLFGWV